MVSGEKVFKITEREDTNLSDGKYIILFNVN